MNLPKAPDWLYWVIATATAAFTMTVFAYGNFTTKDAFDSFSEQIIRRLDRLEEKIDKIMERQR